MRHLSCLLLAFGLMFGLAAPVQAQEQQSRFGLGIQVLGSTASNNLGPGLHFRASTPLNPDVSLAIGSGLTGFIFQGRDDAAFALDPKVSAIASFSTNNTPPLTRLAASGRTCRSETSIPKAARRSTWASVALGCLGRARCSSNLILGFSSARNRRPWSCPFALESFSESVHGRFLFRALLKPKSLAPRPLSHTVCRRSLCHYARPSIRDRRTRLLMRSAHSGPRAGLFAVRTRRSQRIRSTRYRGW